MAAPASGFQILHPPLAVADPARFFKSWLRRIAPDTHHDQASGDETAGRPGGLITRDRPRFAQAALVGSLRGFAAAAARRFKRPATKEY